MGNNEIYRGKNDGIIIFILSKGARHTDELKEIIDNNFNAVKLGTLYSIIARLKTLNYISEYRASSVDGSRRKYYKLTKKGEEYFNSTLLDSFSSVELNLVTSFNEQPIKNTEKVESEVPVKQETVSPNATSEETIEIPNEIQNYSDIINDTVLNDESIEEIDFSSIEIDNDTTFNNSSDNVIEEDTTTELEVANNFVPYEQIYTSKNDYTELNQDSHVNSKYEYSKVLNKLFPKQKIEVNDFEEKIDNEPIVEENKQTDWSEIYNLAEKDGIKVRTSSDTNRYQGSKILLTRLILCTSFITLIFAVLNYLFFTFIIPNTFSKKALLVISIVFGFVFLSSAVAFLLNPHLKVKTLPKFIDLLEIALIIVISTLIISFAVVAIKEIDFKNAVLVFNGLIFPVLISLNLLVYVITLYLLSKFELFETI